MYTISAITNGVEYPIHNPRSSKLIVGDPWYEVGDNVNGSAEFTVYPEHPFFDRVHKLTSEIVIRNDGNEVFRGRVLYDDEDMSGAKKVVCEGELAYLCDSIQRPKVYHDTPVRVYLADLLVNHNRQVEAAKQFQLGTVTVVDSNDSLYRYSNWNTTRECLSDKLIDKLGGHFVVRWENGTRYLDYLADASYYRAASQRIEFGRNLLEFAKNADATDIATCIIPLGAKPEEESSEDGEESSTDQNLDTRLTIESVNGGADYVSDENAVREYGRIFKTAVNDDVTTPSYLKTWGEEYLRSTQYEKLVLEVKAVDLSLQDSRFEGFTVRDQIHCVSVPNGMDAWLPVSSMRFYLMRAEENTLTLGTSGTLKTYTSANRTTASAEAIPTKSDIVQEALRKAKVIFDAQLVGGYAHYLENELVISDNPVLSDSRRMWRWGLGGLAYTDQGYDGAFKTAWTMDGAFVADFITAGTLQANLIKAGVLSDEAGKNYWNMETGEFSLSSTTTVGGKTVSAIAEDAAEDAADDLSDSLDQSGIFNRLTNNGQTQGIYLSGGRLYLNASYIGAGYVTANHINVSTLSAISANVGTLTAGVLQSSNYSSGESGMKLDLTNGTADITGKVTAKEGSIGGWSITTNAIYRTSSVFGSASGMYFGTSGLSITDKFKVDSNGNLRLAGDMVLGLHGIVGENVGKPIVDLNADGSARFGGSAQNTDTSETWLRGKSVDIYTHSNGDIRLYAGSGGGVYLGKSGSTAIESDEQVKDLWEIDSRYEEFFMRLQPTLYRYKNSGHRTHIGYGARAVEQALYDSGLTTEEFAGLIINRDLTIPAEMAHSTTDIHYNELYSLRYQEFGALYALMLQKAIRRIDALEHQCGLS